MREIEMTKGYKTIVDDADYDRLSQWCWYALAGGKGLVYAAHDIWLPVERKRKTILMHRLIMDAPHGLKTDHRNHNTLDNRRDNLRVCTQSQNLMNKRTWQGRKFKGVRRNQNSPNFSAIIWNQGKTEYLGSYSTEEQAALVYDRRAIEIQGEFACLNFPLDTADIHTEQAGKYIQR